MSKIKDISEATIEAFGHVFRLLATPFLARVTNVSWLANANASVQHLLENSAKRGWNDLGLMTPWSLAAFLDSPTLGARVGVY